jgi:hypothetical protein
VAPFNLAEIEDAVGGMDRCSAPGPDGLGPSFYRASWTQVAPDPVQLFDGFHADAVDLGSLNHDHVVLLPKTDGVLAQAPSADQIHLQGPDLPAAAADC